jgi:hypothetical protein
MATDRPDVAFPDSDAGGTAVGTDSLRHLGRWTTAYASWLWVAALATLAADVGLTAYGVRLGLAESNPVAAGLIAEVGLFPALALLKGGALGVGVGGWAVMPAEYRGLVPAGLTLPWALAAVANVAAIGLVVL